MVGVLAVVGKAAGVQSPGAEAQGLLPLEMALNLTHPQTTPRPNPSWSLPAFITDLHSESSLLFLLRVRRERRTDSWTGLVGSPDDCQGLTQDRGGETTDETLANPSNPGHSQRGGEGRATGEGQRGTHQVDRVSVSSSGAEGLRKRPAYPVLRSGAGECLCGDSGNVVKGGASGVRLVKGRGLSEGRSVREEHFVRGRGSARAGSQMRRWVPADSAGGETHRAPPAPRSRRRSHRLLRWLPFFFFFLGGGEAELLDQCLVLREKGRGQAEVRGRGCRR